VNAIVVDEDLMTDKLAKGSHPFSAAIGPSRNVLESGWTEAHRYLVQQWLSSCTLHHRICPTADGRPLPTRVIDVGRTERDLHLHISNGEQGEYVALSHSWGGHKPRETTKATLDQHCRSIHLGESSKTFEDAAKVCRDLGYKYLWIDSLCVVQDDDADWAAEAANMSQVYRNAALTISAESAKDARDGLFAVKERNEQSSTHVIIECDSPSGQPGKVCVRTRAPNVQTSRIVTHFAHDSVPMSESRLASRAWVLQERLLSSRILHFYKEELAWSCCSISHCECRMDAGTTDLSIFKKSQNPDLARKTLAREMHQQWTDLVVDFTHRKLTKIRDRLPAISGLASICNEVTGSRYCAGLFFKDMAYGLLWYSDHDASPAPITRNVENSNLPTWSWVSVTGPVKYLDRQRSQFERRSRGNTVIPILGVEATYSETSGPNTFGDVSFGWVCVVGQVLRVDWERSVFRPWNTDLNKRVQSRKESKPPVPIPDYVGPDATINRNNIYFLRAGKYIMGGMYSSNNTENICLMVEKVIRPQYECVPLFRRWGFVLNAFPSDLVWSERDAPSMYVFLI
jgi:hypothetical protein